MRGTKKFSIRFWGVRGSIPTPGRGTVRYGGNTSCVEVRSAGQIIILDAGTGLRLLGRALMEEFEDRPLNLTLLLTHTHWDHIQGLPFFRPIYQPQCRLRILGCEGARKGLVNVLSAQMESPYFPVPFAKLPGNIEIEELRDLHVNVGAVRVQAFAANHPGVCVGYRLATAEGAVAFFPDNEPRAQLLNSRPAPADDIGDVVESALAHEEGMIRFLRRTDALIIDSQYDREEYRSHLGWGHGCVDHSVGLALKAKIKRLCLFHHDPEHDDARLDRMVAYARRLVTRRKSSLRVDAAREGMVVTIP